MASSSSGMGNIVKWGLIGLAGYWIYTNFFATKAAATPTAPVTPVPVTPITPAAPVTPAFNSLDALYARIVAAAKADNAPSAQSPYHWNVYLVNAGGPSGTDLSLAFPSTDLTKEITAAQYWAGMSQLLATNYGMKGLGFYGGLAAIHRRRYA